MINMDDNISDELLAAYIDGNTTDEENAFVECHIDGDPALAELVDIAQDAALADAFGWTVGYDDMAGDNGDAEVVEAIPAAAQGDDGVVVAVLPDSNDDDEGRIFDNGGDSFQADAGSIQENGFVGDDMPAGDDMMLDI